MHWIILEPGSFYRHGPVEAVEASKVVPPGSPPSTQRIYLVHLRYKGRPLEAAFFNRRRAVEFWKSLPPEEESVK